MLSRNELPVNDAGAVGLTDVDNCPPASAARRLKAAFGRVGPAAPPAAILDLIREVAEEVCAVDDRLVYVEAATHHNRYDLQELHKLDPVSSASATLGGATTQ